MTSTQHIAVHTDDGPIHVTLEGNGEAVVLLHPGGLDSSVWDELSASLAQTHQVVRFDARSHGRSATAHTDHSPAADLILVLDALRINAAHLIGSSMGAMTATEAAIRMPERVRSLGLIGGEVWPDEHDTDPFIVECTQEANRAIAEANGDRWINAMLRLTVDGPYRRPHESPHKLRERVAGLLGRSVQTHASATGRQLWTPVRHRLNEVNIPTLVVVGALDSDAVNATARMIDEQIHGARSVRLAGVGHLAMLEAPNRTIRALRAHLSGALPAVRPTQDDEEEATT